ncbi:MAG TPA: FIST N-terminal domain-containing protein [Planctomycetaceae bacterium]|nr:FIST N-terminal domain-containing protein [Planctomycetaceae bacterium]
MPYAASLSTRADTQAAFEDVCRDVRNQLQGARPDLAFLFVSPSHRDQLERGLELLCAELGCRHLIGCTGESIAGAGIEVENEPAISLWAAALPGVELESFHLEFQRSPDGVFSTGFPELTDDIRRDAQAVFFVGDPYSCAPDLLIDQLADELPGVPLIGGMASGGAAPEQNRLFWNRALLNRGGVGVIVCGGPPIRSIVSQGCRRIGTTFVVTKAQQNVVLELGGRPALERLQELFQSLPQEERALMQRGLHLGIVMNEYQETFQSGDFLISNVIGADQDSGAIGIGNLIRVGQTVQFHVRDAETADEELLQLLQRATADHAHYGAALLFSCNGRGTRLFSKPNHDAQAIQSVCGPLPLAGFFAQGELGPVGGKNYIHGFTASIALFGGV